MSLLQLLEQSSKTGGLPGLRQRVCSVVLILLGLHTPQIQLRDSTPVAGWIDNAALRSVWSDR